MAKRASTRAPLPVTLLVLSFLCPTELSLYIAGLRLPPHRLALLALVPFALFKLFAGRGIRLRAFDAVFVLFAIWTTAIYGYHADHEGFVYGGSLALESLGGYLVARAWIRDPATFRGTLRLMTAAIAVSAIIALPETLLGKIYTHDLLAGLTGYVHPTAVEVRMGFLTRAYGTFDHPIHYGTFCAALFAMFWFAQKRTTLRLAFAMFLGGAALLGVSSAPLLCIALQAAMLAWEYGTRGIAQRTAMTLAVLVGLYIGASLVATRSPINLIATGMTLDSWTGFYRLQIWENGLNNVWASPWTGIGLADWDRPAWMVSSTVDAFWLVVAMRSGIPAFLLLALGVVLIGRAVVNRGMRSPDRAVRYLSLGWMMSLIALSLIACTVHYWNVLHAFFFFFIGLAGWIADPVRVRVAEKVRHAPKRALRGQGYRPLEPRPDDAPGLTGAPVFDLPGPPRLAI